MAVSLSLLLTSLPAAASRIEFTGTLTDSQGTPLNGAYLLDFDLWDAPEGGRQVWSESIYVEAKAGVFKATLGRHSSMPGAVISGSHRLGVAAPAGTGWISRASKRPKRLDITSPVEPVPVSRPPTLSQPTSASPFPKTFEKRRIKDLESELTAAREELARRPPAAPPRVYTVRPGETLRSVALKLFGDAGRWVELYEANEDRIQRAGDLTPGQRLLIPRSPGRSAKP